MITLQDLITFCSPVSARGNHDGPVGDLRNDSRSVTPGDIFIAVKGYQTDGHAFRDQAVQKGAKVIITEEEYKSPEDIAVLQVNDTRAILSPLAQYFAGSPAEKLSITGITGTNGKTTVATLVWQILRRLDQKAALLGTVSKRINRKVFPSRLTTADPVELASDMKEMVSEGCKFLVMEVSSHALHQKRVAGIPFDVAAFTNLSLDHLDYHHSMDAYAAAKKILFDELQETGRAVLNNDDPYSKVMAADTKGACIRFGFAEHSPVQAVIHNISDRGIEMEVDGMLISSPLIGRFNAYNVAQAFLICEALGFERKKIAEAVADCRGAEGRMERANTGLQQEEQPLVVVDYSHTPDSLKNAASTLAGLKKEHQNLIIVFGCGGDRDKTKRPVMAQVAEEWGDSVIVTSDNPRTEDPDRIIEDIVKGFSSSFAPRLISSRKEAIRTAVLECGPDGIILIAGKGHETYQEINGERHHFDDREVARQALSERNGHLKKEEVH